MAHIIIQRLVTLHAEAWANHGTTKVVEQVHYSHFDPPVLKEIHIDPKNETLVISEIDPKNKTLFIGETVYHMKIENMDKYYDIVWFWP